MFTSEELKREIIRIEEEPVSAMNAALRVQFDAARNQQLASLAVAYQLARLVELMEKMKTLVAAR